MWRWLVFRFMGRSEHHLRERGGPSPGAPPSEELGDEQTDGRSDEVPGAGPCHANATLRHPPTVRKRKRALEPETCAGTGGW